MYRYYMINVVAKKNVVAKSQTLLTGQNEDTNTRIGTFSLFLAMSISKLLIHNAKGKFN